MRNCARAPARCCFSATDGSCLALLPSCGQRRSTICRSWRRCAGPAPTRRAMRRWRDMRASSRTCPHGEKHVRLERFGGATGIVAAAAIVTQFALVGTAGTDAPSLLRAKARWELATLLRVVGGLGMMWFTTGFAARLRRFGFGPAGPTTVVLGAGLLWGAVWLISAAFNSVAIAEAVRGDAEWSVRWLSILGSQTVLVLTPTLMIT